MIVLEHRILDHIGFDLALDLLVEAASSAQHEHE
jgi:hypothetical protein